MAIYCCGPECEQATLEATPDQARDIWRIHDNHDGAIACPIIHPGKDKP